MYKIIRSDEEPAHGEGVIWVRPNGLIRVSAAHLGWRLPNARELEAVKELDLPREDVLTNSRVPRVDPTPADDGGFDANGSPITAEQIAILNANRSLDDGQGAPNE